MFLLETPAEWANTLTLLHLWYKYVLCVQYIDAFDYNAAETFLRGGGGGG